MMQAIKSTRPGGSVGDVGVPHSVTLDGADLVFRHIRLFGGPAPVRRYLPQLIDLVFAGNQSRKSIRPRAAARSRRRRLPGIGRAACNQDALASFRN
jgi:threonine dehydrogenase-like Zn-dependent dehydrogenase